MGTLERLARRLAALEATVRDVVSTPQLAHSAIVDGAIDQVITVDTGTLDEHGNPVFREEVVARYGAQGDGGNTVVTFDDPVPPPPTAPTVTPGPGFMVVGWDGHLAGVDEVPSYVRAVGVFVGTSTDVIPSAETLRAELPPTGEGTEVTVGSLPAGEYLVSLVAMSHGGNWSEPAPYRLGGPGTSASTVLIEEAIAKAEAAAAAAALAVNQATEADRRAAEARAVADAVSAAANRTDGKAVDALRRGDVSILAADGKTRVTYSLNPPGGAPGGSGDTWLQVTESGVAVGFWECTTGDVDPIAPPVPATAVVAPAAPTFVNRPGTSRDSYTVPAAAGVAYLVDSVVKPAGTYTDKEGPVAVSATPLSGFAFDPTARTVWAGTLSTDGSGVRDPVTATPPTFTDVDGSVDDTVTLAPFTPPEGATWHLNGALVDAGEHPASGTVTVEAVAGEWWTFGSATTTWSFTFDPLVYVAPAAPTFTDRSGTSNDTYTIPDVAGVTYRVGVTIRPAGTYPASGTVTITAAPAPGYALTGDTTWSHAFSDVVDPAIEVEALAPTFTDLPGVASDTVTIPSGAGIAYTVNGAPATAGAYPASGTVTVSAAPLEGYVLTGTSTWTRTYSTARTTVTATPPTFTDVDGTTGDTVGIPTRTGVAYTLNGSPVAAGTHPASGTVTVAAAAAGDPYELTGTTSWPFTFDPLAYVTPTPPTFTDQPGVASDTVTVPSTAGVAYTVNGTARAAGTYPATGTVTVTAAPTSGHGFTTGATTSWAHTYTTTRTTVTPTAPTFADVNGTASDTYTIPATTGVAYTVNGTARAPGTYPATGTVTVVASAAGDAYQLAGGVTTTWTQAFDAATYAAPTAPTFNDTTDTYTIPTTAGVDYIVDGQTRTAGTYTVPVGGTLATATFAGLADGAAWPTPWTLGWGQGGASGATVQAQAGRITAGGIANWASKWNAVADIVVADVDITYKLTLGAAGGERTYHHLMVRIPTSAGAQPSEGYDLVVDGAGAILHRMVGWGSGANLGSITLPTVMGAAYRVRLQAVGIALRAKLWPASGSEPTGWGIDTTDTTYATGRPGVQIVGGGGVGPYHHDVDDIVISAPGGGQTVTVTVTAQARPGYTLTGTTTWTHMYT